jgi:hypothetical protein
MHPIPPFQGVAGPDMETLAHLEINMATLCRCLAKAHLACEAEIHQLTHPSIVSIPIPPWEGEDEGACPIEVVAAILQAEADMALRQTGEEAIEEATDPQAVGVAMALQDRMAGPL